MRFSAGVVRCRLRRPGETSALGGVSGRFGLRNRPEVASGVRESLGERGGTVVVDELDAKLHPELLRYVILLFKDPEVNKSGAQLIFSSQDVSTMRNDVFRRDEIWFAARAEGEASQLWSLADTQPWRMRSVQPGANSVVPQLWQNALASRSLRICSGVFLHSRNTSISVTPLPRRNSSSSISSATNLAIISSLTPSALICRAIPSYFDP